ncbi:hypothetical protein AN964_07745 [Heyndrickxia shackletonii]|uniref:Prepilin-type N-terminal cleavage/methylation domain-containing protein n=1 Tax=Heyndrickxia shackletonii TaxID=157838 RepID=A0A0Q3WX98_9BACI|nr:type II secretion system protein [Heyndrickxia shackletonii]KQL53395.1 hypothetical protein AN964_07745 [Heyndrickxia shackletonii]NEY99963.1 type II secretion system protein [Heyndrickxia shackletonii]
MRSRFQKVMKNQKGMTLVELLAVIVILAIVTAIAVPSIGGIINKSKDDAQKSNALMIINAAKLAVVSNNETIMGKINSTDHKITLQDLVDEGFLDSVPQNPYLKETTYTGDKNYVTVTQAGSKYVYTVTLDNKSGTGNTTTYDEKGKATK